MDIFYHMSPLIANTCFTELEVRNGMKRMVFPTFGELCKQSRKNAGYSDADKAGRLIMVNGKDLRRGEADQYLFKPDTIVTMQEVYGTPGLIDGYCDMSCAIGKMRGQSIKDMLRYIEKQHSELQNHICGIFEKLTDGTATDEEKEIALFAMSTVRRLRGRLEDLEAVFKFKLLEYENTAVATAV